MFRDQKHLALVRWGVGLSVMGMAPHSLAAIERTPVLMAKPPYNCLTREVWSPAKQAWCDRFGPHFEQDDWPELTSPDNRESEGDRNRYTTVDLKTFPRDMPRTGPEPKSIALSLIDLPEAEGNSQKRTSVSIKKGQSAVVMLSQVGLADDSVQGIRYRLEFEPKGRMDAEEQWQLIWVGRQQLCWPGRGPEAWTNQPCL